jgi:hypothetical protein
MNVERYLFLFRKFLLDGVKIVLDGGMVVITVTVREFSRWRDKMSLKRDTLCENAFPPGVVCRWVVCRRMSGSGLCESGDSSIPIAVAIGVLAAKPAYEVSIHKMEPQKR